MRRKQKEAHQCRLQRRKKNPMFIYFSIKSCTFIVIIQSKKNNNNNPALTSEAVSVIEGCASVMTERHTKTKLCSSRKSHVTQQWRCIINRPTDHVTWTAVTLTWSTVNLKGFNQRRLDSLFLKTCHLPTRRFQELFKNQEKESSCLWGTPKNYIAMTQPSSTSRTVLNPSPL